MNLFEDVDFSKFDPISKYTVRCPHCNSEIFMINNEKSPDYFRDIANDYKKQLTYAQKYLKEIDEWCETEFGITKIGWDLQRIKDKYNRPEDRKDGD